MEKGANASGRGNMRSSRSPFLVIVLLVVSALLAYNYWSVSARNGELTQEVETLRFSFREVSGKHLSLEKQAGELTKQVSEKIQKITQMEAKVGETEQKLTESVNEVNVLKGQLQSAQNAENGLKADAEQARKEKDALAGELENTKKQLTDLQNAPKVCDKLACKDPLREVITAMTKSLGKAAINGALKQNNVDLNAVAGDLLEGGEPEKPQLGANENPQPAA